MPSLVTTDGERFSGKCFHDQNERCFTVNENFRNWKKRLDDATTPEECDQVIGEIMSDPEASASIGNGLPIELVESVCKLVTDSVYTALREIVADADYMESDYVPVEYIKFLLTQQVTGARVLMEALDTSNIPVDYGDIPDDISSLEGL
jgi:hypothetical protein